MRNFSARRTVTEPLQHETAVAIVVAGVAATSAAVKNENNNNDRH